MTTSDRLWSNTDRELVADLLEDRLESIGMTYEAAAGELLDQLTADGWRPIHRVYGYHVENIPGVIPPGDVTLIYRGGAEDA